MRARPLVLLALLASAPAPAQEPIPVAPSGPVFALRGGVGVPSGRVALAGPDVADVVSRKVPVGVELGYRFGRRIWALLHFELAHATPASGICATATSCSASDLRFGAQLALRLFPGKRLDPWIGAGIGAEVLELEGKDRASGAELEQSWAGVELPFVEAGVDLALGDRIAIGPFASLSFVRFTSETTRGAGGKVSGTVQGRAQHRWLGAGLRATLKL